MIDEKELALEAIRKKLVGKKLSYKEIYAVMDEIANERLGDILTTYFVASGYSKGFSDQEIYYLTCAMVKTGEKLHFRGIVADKHSIGGVPGGRVSLIIVPIVAAAGFKIPKSSSRAITTPSGTADTMEVFSQVIFDKEDIYKIVEKTNACIVWGGSFKIAPADDEIIRIEEPLLFESYDKILVSVMAKKVAFSSTHLVIDLPYGATAKLHRPEDAKLLARKFENLAHKFNIKIKTDISLAEEPVGCGIGPFLEAKDALSVLEQKADRQLPLEQKALRLAGKLLELCLEDAPSSFAKKIKKEYKDADSWAAYLLASGQALAKMREIVKAQKGDPNVTSDSLILSGIYHDIKAEKSGKIKLVNNKHITQIAKILGAPEEKKAGIYLQKKLNDPVEKGEVMFRLYAENSYKLREAFASIATFPIYVLDGK